MSAAALRLERVQPEFVEFAATAKASEVFGPQFPRLDMYSPFKHDGASFDGYSPLLSSQMNEQGSASALNAAAVLIMALLILLKLL